VEIMREVLTSAIYSHVTRPPSILPRSHSSSLVPSKRLPLSSPALISPTFAVNHARAKDPAVRLPKERFLHLIAYLPSSGYHACFDQGEIQLPFFLLHMPSLPYLPMVYELCILTLTPLYMHSCSH
jgi:hypothetical protein